ncbi:DUF262 domain-containing protein [endosymbiont GvMRE of Glomus versiforme]|uniref:DUF262 domain-containing protein n=1 Tax=endosymbiont GvMRE of Glomus versiforme TaxID=2039283 RepID=UPI000EC94C37|nr:DUF262 domain-containing protein [endosymbiont GvMRE of Glomus versiforme]RHZ36842.1 RloF [endosymbiont GvMRE of Glomus versiforme]
MKKFRPELVSLQELLLKDERQLSIPPYQRSYSWSTDNWEDFLRTIRDFTDNHYKKKDEICFLGEIILGLNDEQSTYDIIDGQQRLLTIFIFLMAIWEERKKLFEKIEIDELRKVENEILQTIFDIDKFEVIKEKMKILETYKPRLKILKRRDDNDFEIMLKEVFRNEKVSSKEKTSTLYKCRDWFKKEFKFIEEEESGILLRYLKVVLSKLSFVEIKLQEKSDLIDIFMLLNTTGINLSSSDILKSLLVKQCKNLKPWEVETKWDKQIISVICKSRENSKISKEMNYFLRLYLKGKYNSEPKGNIVRSFLNILEKDKEDADKLFSELAVYAEAYRNFKNPEQEYWEKSWSTKMYFLINDINLLGLKQLDSIVICLIVNSRNFTQKQKDFTISALEKLILYSFRANLVKENSAIHLFNAVPAWLNSIKRGDFVEEVNKSKFLTKEFQKNETDDFYKHLLTYQRRKNNVWKYVFSKYYLAKDGEMEEINKKFYDDIQVEHLLSQNPRDKKQLGEEIVYTLGNLTLLREKRNKKQSNKPWIEKKLELKKLGKKCLLSLEGTRSPLVLWENQPTLQDVMNRAHWLIEDFTRLNIFEEK